MPLEKRREIVHPGVSIPSPHQQQGSDRAGWFLFLDVSLGSAPAANVSSLGREIGEEQRGSVAKGNVSSEMCRKLAQTALPKV